MLKVLLALAAISSATSAMADDEGDIAQAWNEAHQVCRMGESIDGRTLPAQTVEESCATRENIGFILESHGYCWSGSEQEWFLPGEDHGLCDETPSF